jgi:hypothetical protein
MLTNTKRALLLLILSTAAVPITPALAQAVSSGGKDILLQLLPFALIGAAVWFFARKGKQARTGTTPVSRDARKSLLFGDVTLSTKPEVAENQIKTMIEEAKAKAQEYEWQFKDSGEKDGTKHQLKLAYNQVVKLLEFKRDNISLNDSKLKSICKQQDTDHFLKTHDFGKLHFINNYNYDHYKLNEATKYFHSYLVDKDELFAFQAELIKLKSESMIIDINYTISNAKKIIPDHHLIVPLQAAVAALAPHNDYSKFSHHAELKELRTALHSVEMKSLSTNRAKVLVQGRGHRSETPFRNAQEAYQNVKRGLYVPASCEITCFVTDAYGENVKVFSGSTDWQTDFSGFKFHTDWRPQ